MRSVIYGIMLGACLLAGCMITPEGARVSAPPPAVQGSNDVQGAPITVPGAGMGVGAGNPAAPGPSGVGPAPPR